MVTEIVAPIILMRTQATSVIEPRLMLDYQVAVQATLMQEQVATLAALDCLRLVEVSGVFLLISLSVEQRYIPNHRHEITDCISF